MRSFTLEDIADESHRCFVLIFDDSREPTGHPSFGTAPPLGFYSSQFEPNDFIVAEAVTEVDGQLCPDWNTRFLIRLAGRHITSDEVRSCQYRSLLGLSEIRVELDDGTMLSRRYFAGWPATLLPADPKMPRGRDLYRFISDKLKATSEQ